MAKKKKSEDNVIATNRKAAFRYQLMETVEAGIALMGSEVKSLRDRKANLTDSYAVIDRGELWLLNAHISQYPNAKYTNHEPLRKRKLLIHKKELSKLTIKLNERGLTLVPVKLYFKGPYAKVLLALGKGKKLFDKRETIKKREVERDINRSLRNK